MRDNMFTTFWSSLCICAPLSPSSFSLCSSSFNNDPTDMRGKIELLGEAEAESDLDILGLFGEIDFGFPVN